MNLPYKTLDWQRPVATEEISTKLLKENPINSSEGFVGAPWATLIDYKLQGDFLRQQHVEEYLHLLEEQDQTRDNFTICQTYRFRELIKNFKRANIKRVFCPHATEENIEGVEIHPFPLLNPNEISPAEQKDVYYSFIGLYRKDYLSDTRYKIFVDTHPKNCVIIQRFNWHFDFQVYHKQMTGQAIPPAHAFLEENNKAEYSDILSRSRYSLCPSGVGPSSIRIYESLKAGAIPVVLADTFRFPRIKGLDWSGCTIKIEEKDYHALRDVLDSISEEEESSFRENGYKAYEKVSGENFVQCIRDYYE